MGVVCVDGCVCVKCQEEAVMSRILDAEQSQFVEQMRRRVAELEIEVCTTRRFTFLFTYFTASLIAQLMCISPSTATDKQTVVLIPFHSSCMHFHYSRLS